MLELKFGRTFLLLLAASCSAPTPRTAATPTATPTTATSSNVASPWDTTGKPAADSPPTLRLPTVARPRRYTVDLTLDPAATTFTGTITTELQINETTSRLWLNAHEITVDNATITAAGQTHKATATTSGEFLGLQVAQPLAPGPATLTIAYHGQIHPGDGDGIYTAKEGGEWYAFTQFEATDAREAFPCFDEPSYKVPWQLTLHTKQNLVALANTPIESETNEANGNKAVRFAETKPLPSYLVAFAVGPFEFVDAGKTRHGVPVRMVVPRGRTADVTYPRDVTLPILALLEDYFGIPYPYPKLDIVAVSIFNAGAMENPGLITFRQSLMVTKPAERTLADEKNYATVAAHEIAHQWFGDYVTMAWWDDTWLNESFANWLESKITAQFKPEWQVAVDAVGAKSAVMRSDSLESARAIQQPIETTNDIANAFDGITYEKGQAVLNMIERSIGAETFKRGVRLHMQKHAFGNATYEDFVGAMTEAAGTDMRPMFDAFVRHSGVPLVTFELTCNGAQSKLHLTQSRYAPTGSKIDPKQTWTLPVCVRLGFDSKLAQDKSLPTTACATMTTADADLSLPACPTWILPNQDSIGYYRMRLQGDLLPKLLAKAATLSLPERIGLLGDINALVLSGDVPKSQALELAATLAKDKHRQIVDETLGAVDSIDDMVPDALRGNYERFVRTLYGARARELTWRSKPGEDANTKQLRPRLLAMVAIQGRDTALAKEAQTLATTWLDTRKGVDAELIDTVLAVAGRYGNQALFDRLHELAQKTDDRDDRARFLGAMGSFVDPAIVRQALAISLTDEFELRDSAALLQGAFADAHNRPIGYDFIKTNFDKIAAKLPELYRPYLAYSFVPLCDDSLVPEIEKLFGAKIAAFNGGPRAMAQALEQLKLCAMQRKAELPGVTAFLKKQ